MTNGGGAYKPGIVRINEELSWARRCHFFPALMASSHLPHGAKLSNLFRIGKKNTEESHGGGASKNKNNNGGGAYKRRLSHPKGM